MGVVLEDLWRVKVVVRRDKSVWQLAHLLRQMAHMSQLLGSIDGVGSGDGDRCIERQHQLLLKEGDRRALFLDCCQCSL